MGKGKEMASEKKLDCVILGLLSHEDLTGYEIKKRIDHSLKFFWSASYGSIYPTLNDLHKRGLVTKRDGSDSRRTKLVYSITEGGRDYLKKWLTLSVEKDALHYETLLKLFFGNEQGTEQAVIHIRAFQEKTKAGLSELLEFEKTLEHCIDDDDAHKYYLITVRFGIKSYRAYLEWCEETIKVLEED